MPSSDSQDRLAVGAVVRATGLSEHTIRAWERRHGAVTPQRTDGGTRLYSRADVARLRLLKRAVDEGHRIGSVASLDDEAVEALLSDREAPAPPRLEPVLRALERFDAPETERLLSLQLAALGSDGFVDQVALPLLREIGERWEAGEFGPAAEHLASHTTRSLLGVVLRERSARASGAPVVLATLPGERHEFGLLVAALLCATAGFAPVYLGIDLPPEEIALAAARCGAPLVVLASAGAGPEGHPIEAAGRLREKLPPAIELWIGGQPPASPGWPAGIRGVSSFDHLRQLLTGAIADPV